MLKELGKHDWLGILGLQAEDVPGALILRGTRNLQSQYDVARELFSNVRDLGAPNGLIEHVLIGEFRGRRIGFACVYGAAMASEIVHIFGVLGTRAVIQTGNCGALADDLNAGDLFVPTEAFCGEGAAQYYRNGSVSTASPELLASHALVGSDSPPTRRGRIYTTAALLAEGAADLEHWYAQGFAAVDMETATTFSVAEHFGMQRAAILYAFDNPRRREHILLTDAEKDVRRARANQTARELAFALALEAIDAATP